MATKSRQTHSLQKGGRSSVLGRDLAVVFTGWYAPSVCRSVKRSSGLRCFLLTLISNRNGALMVLTPSHPRTLCAD